MGRDRPRSAPPAVSAAVLAYLVVSVLVVVPYVAWRSRAGARNAARRLAPGADR